MWYLAKTLLLSHNNASNWLTIPTDQKKLHSQISENSIWHFLSCHIFYSIKKKATHVCTYDDQTTAKHCIAGTFNIQHPHIDEVINRCQNENVPPLTKNMVDRATGRHNRTSTSTSYRQSACEHAISINCVSISHIESNAMIRHISTFFTFISCMIHVDRTPHLMSDAMYYMTICHCCCFPISPSPLNTNYSNFLTCKWKIP